MTRVGIRCDAGRTVGVGHLARCVALAEELVHRGTSVVFLGDLGGVAWAEGQLAQRGLQLEAAPVTPADHAEAARALALDAIVLDGYHLPHGIGAALRKAGVRVLSVVDGDFGDQEADLVLDQNLGSEEHAPPAQGVFLGGVRYALLRDDVRTLRPSSAPTAAEAAVPEVFCFFGGTDAYDAGLAVIPLLLSTGLPLKASVVAPREASAAALTALDRGPDQQLTVLGPVDDLAQRVVAADLVLSASGTSTWELCCLGAAMGLVAVTENQEIGYQRTLALGVAAGVGRLAALTGDANTREAAVQVLRTLLTDAAARQALAAKGWSVVDGRGRERVADALLEGL